MKVVLILILCLLTVLTHAQDYPRQTYNLEKLADEIFPMQDLDLNYEELYENLAQLLSNPIDLNAAGPEELRSLFVLREEQVDQLLRYRTEQGPLLSIYELQAVPGFDPATIYRLVPFVTVTDPSQSINKNFFKRVTSERNNFFIMRYEQTLENKKGNLSDTDSATHYAGSPGKFYTRFRVNRTGDFSFGFTLEKDAGESISWNPNQKKYGFDYQSFHAQVMNKGRLKNLIVGDFQAQFGQGLLLGSSFGMGKGSESITTIRRANLGFLPYTSVNEFGFFRGVAAITSLHKNLNLSGFISNLGRDAKTAEQAEDISIISSLGTTGLHRLPSELEARKKIDEMNFGIVLNYKKQSLDAGLIFHQTQFSIPILKDPTPYNQFTFSGAHNSNVGAFLNYTWKNLTFFSEAAQTLGNGRALTAGILGSLTHRLDISFLYRNFAKDFHTFYSNAVSENTIPQNESGIYWGWKYLFTKQYSFAGYVDLFRFPWLRYRSYSPSEGSEWLLRFNYQPTKTVTLFVQAREESKARNMAEDFNVYQPGQGVKRNLWLNADYSAAPYLSFKTRAQMSTYTLGGHRTKGFAMVQDINLDFHRISISTRYALFDTDDYDNRQYVYERDMWLTFSFPAYFGVGIRSYVMLQYKVSQKIDLWLRWARTEFTDRNIIGSGSETIFGNTKNDLKLQARIRL